MMQSHRDVARRYELDQLMNCTFPHLVPGGCSRYAAHWHTSFTAVLQMAVAKRLRCGAIRAPRAFTTASMTFIGAKMVLSPTWPP